MAPLTLQSAIKLNSGHEIPHLGYGPRRQGRGSHRLRRRLQKRSRLRRRHPQNHRQDPRSAIFFTSKVPGRGLNYADAKAQVDRTLKETGLDYIDLMLLHAPTAAPRAARARARRAGKGGVISVGQWEIHPWLPRNDIAEWCAKRNVAVEAYSPIVRGERWGEKAVVALADKYGNVTHSRILENADLYNFELTPEEVASLETKEYAPVCWDPTVSPIQD
ncbi:unnamed protein product [Parascedosporium putredinis]|uniref:NADP-dependent oxidoreductase domain-containing protein n=1 Tax=Parascedosporium putredinis TaxID=1442378 RepID=A0A9P1HBZ8_9PEZI|nr:unnamed protein product [Parascedosporium putredinis]CAI8002807.1 unnamed protein product [Parascedosporium putredinis]